MNVGDKVRVVNNLVIGKGLEGEIVGLHKVDKHFVLAEVQFNAYEDPLYGAYDIRDLEKIKIHDKMTDLM